MRLVLRAAAVSDLDDIFDYSLAAHGAEAAADYAISIGAVMERLLDHPQLGSASDLRSDIRSIPAGEHRVYYRIEGQAIVVARVLHKAMDVERHL